MLFRVVQAVFFTANMAHPDDWWQVTQVAYKNVYGNAMSVQEQQERADGVFVDLPWEYHSDYRLRNTIYPIFHSVPLYLLKITGLDSNFAVRICPTLVHSFLVMISDYYFWTVGKEVVGKIPTQVAFVFYLTNRVQNAFLTRCFTNSIEQILTVVGFYYYQRVSSKLSRHTFIFTALVSV